MMIKFFIFSLLFLSLCYPQNGLETEKNEKQHIYYDIGKIKIKPEFLISSGSDNIQVYKTIANTDIEISPGGGIGGAITLGYNLYPNIDLEITIGYKKSVISESEGREIKDVTGTFKRTAVILSPKFNIPLFLNGRFICGGGIGYYAPADLDINFEKIPYGDHIIYKYKNNIGYNLMTGYEYFLSKNISVGINIHYCNLYYHLKSCSINNESIPLESLPADDRNKFKRIDGSGFDLGIFFTIY